jgi:solute carrier family 15 (oligopeptide transporter), member 1
MLNKISAYLGGHPKGFWFIFWGEFAERCSYYGVCVILAKYMSEELGLGQADAGTYLSFFIAACYFLPLVGGWVADRFIGKYWTIVGFSIPYIMGHILLGIEEIGYMIGALTLLAMGSGVIKPNISSLMGLTYDQQRPGQTQLRSNAFAIYYLSINIGAAISQFAMPSLRTAYGYSAAFRFPAILMVFALGFFALGKRYYAKETVGYVPVSAEERRERLRVLGGIIGLFVLVTFFWAIFYQSASTWVFFGQACMNFDILGYTVDPDQLQAFNSVFIVIFLPLVMVAWTYLHRLGFRLRPTDKMLAGFVITACCMGVMALSAFLAGRAELVTVNRAGTEITEWVVSEANKVSMWWQIFAYLLLTVAEILISVTGLELAYTAAPKAMAGFVTGCWLATVGAANLFINAYLTRRYTDMQPALYFALLTGLMLVVSVAFVSVARRFNRAEAAKLSSESAAVLSET